jgi:hypothetical protein
MSSLTVRKGVVEDPLIVHNTKHDLGDKHIRRESDVRLTRKEDKGKVKVAFEIKGYQKFTSIRIYQVGDPHPPTTILPELGPGDPHVLQLYSFRSPTVGNRWAMFLFDFDPKFDVDFKSEFTIDPQCNETLGQDMTILLTYTNRDFKDNPQNYFSRSFPFQGRNFP